MPSTRRLPPLERTDARDHPHRGRLAGAVGTEEPEGLALANGEVDAVDGDEVAEALHETMGLDHGRGRWTPAVGAPSPFRSDSGTSVVGEECDVIVR